MLKKIVSLFAGCLLITATSASLASTILPCPMTPQEATQNGWKPLPIAGAPAGDSYLFNAAQIQRWGNAGMYTYIAVCSYEGNSKLSFVRPGYIKTSHAMLIPENPQYWDNDSYPTTCRTNVAECQFMFND